MASQHNCSIRLSWYNNKHEEVSDSKVNFVRTSYLDTGSYFRPERRQSAHEGGKGGSPYAPTAFTVIPKEILLVLIYVALHYKPEGCGFDSRWCYWNFSLT